MRKFYTASLLISLFSTASAVAQGSYVSYDSVIGKFTAPVEVVNAADGSNRLFIVQQNGVIRVYDPANGGLQTTPFLNVSTSITFSGEQGLLSMAFHPAYEVNGYFYLYYNNSSGAIELARYQVSANRNIAGTTGQVLLTIPKPFTNHNGGHLQFAADSTLYFATGDGGSGNDPNNYALSRTSRLGKMLRLKVYTNATGPLFEAPDDNPFVNDPTYDSLIWARGLRNPFRWSFDRLTGDMWIGDVGQGAKEEVNFRPASSTGGENYGWKCYEGSIRNPNISACDSPDYVAPVFDYNNPSSGGSSVVGGYVYRGSLYPSLYGYYITSDVYTDSIYLIKPNGGGWTILRSKSLYSVIVSFGEGEDGTIYAVSQATGNIYRVSPLAVLSANAVTLTAKRGVNGNEVKWTTISEEANTGFLVQYSIDGNRFLDAGMIRGSGGATAAYSFFHSIKSSAELYYRIAISEPGATVRYSAVVRLDGRAVNYQIYPSLVRNGKLMINAGSTVHQMQILNSNGSIVFERSNLPAGQTAVYLPALAKGVYIVRLTGEEVFTEKIMIE